jgi:microcystin-dependent protein
MFYFLNNSTWFVLSPWVQSDSIAAASEKMALNNVITTNVGIGTTPNSSFKLDVSGPVKISDTVSIGGSVYVKAGNLTLAAGNIKANVGNISTNSGNISTTTGKVTAKGFSSDITDINVAGPVPKGGIIMWSGTIANIPAGWALCDGTNGSPDLRERFIVGAGGENATNPVRGLKYDVGNSGADTNAVMKLSIAQMPKHKHTGTTTGTGLHTHTYKDRYVDDWNKDGVFAGSSGSYMSKVGQNSTTSTTTAGTGDHSHTIPEDGGGASFDNRPPYYALAFIIKI